MIAKLSKSFFSLCPVLALLVSCGKKVEEGSTSEIRREDATLPASITLEASATGTLNRQNALYTIPRDGRVKLPTTIKASGKTASLRVRMDMNIIDGDDEFHCYWTGKGLYYEFTNCEDEDGDLGLTLENVSQFQFAIDQDKIIKLSLEAAPAGTTVKATVELAPHWY
jgi:hypothetical protein